MGRLYVENDKILTEIIARTLAREIDISEQTDWDAIEIIANQCPYEGGNAVYAARDLYSLQNIDAYYDDEACVQASNQRKAFVEPQHFDPEEQAFLQTKEASLPLSMENNSLIVYPNPLQDILVISGLENRKDTEIQLLDARGNLVYLQRFGNACPISKVDVKNVSNGLYTLRISSSNAGIFVKKISVNH
jgi:hypothetical protein